jgi:hypothetical protein
LKKCQFCAEDIQDAAIVCKHCGRDLFPGRAPTVAVPTTAPLAVAPPETQPKSLEERRGILSRAIQTQVTPTMRVESRTDDQVVLVFGEKTNHLLHFLIGIFTLGLWWIVWLVIALTNRESHRLITVSELGVVATRDY